MEKKMDIGMVGMAVMGSNLALNMADHGFDVACYNYTPDLTEKVLREHPHKHMHGFFNLQEFVDSLQKPRRIMLLIMAGEPVDSMIEQLMPLLEPGDIILDGGNSYFGDTRRRQAKLQQAGIHYFGVGISGGENGARKGPCIMPGGDKEAYEFVRPVYEAVAAKADGQPCCSYIGPDGAGHYVKMVHNGIEYADMQLIAEAYLLLKYAGGYSNRQIAEIFHQWNQGELRSFLIGITALGYVCSFGGFTTLVSYMYPLLGYMGILLLVVLTVAWFEERENIVREKFLRRKMMRLLFRKYDDDYEFTAKHKKDFHKLGEMSAADTEGLKQDIKSYVKDVVENTDDLQTYAEENLSMKGSPLKKEEKNSK